MTKMMAVLVTAALLLTRGAAAGAQPAPVPVRCRAETNLLTISGTVHTRAAPYFVEVELAVHNKSAARLWIDPSRITLVPADGHPVSAAPPQQVLETLYVPSSNYVDAAGVVVSGSFAIGIGIGPIDFRRRALEARILRADSIAGDARHSGSVYFHPQAWPDQFHVIVDGLRLGVAAALPAVPVRDCVMPVRLRMPPKPPVAPVPGARRMDLTARATAGPLTLVISAIEIARFATTLTVTVENASDRDADLFAAFGRAQLVDDAAAAYPLRILRSDLPDRVSSRGTARGRLVFEPLPVDQPPPRVTLALPGVRVGDLVHDIAVVIAL